MMDVLIQSAKIIDREGPYHLQTKDILIRGTKVHQIASSISAEKAKVIKGNNLHVSSGWIDLHANLQDPGFEHKEDLTSGLNAAAAGGFTKVAVSPISQPVRDSKAQIEYLMNVSKGNIVDVLPYGTVSDKAAGKELAELKDMRDSGAIAFFDGKQSLSNPNLLTRALEYCKSFDGLIINFPNTREISADGVMNEGSVSTQLGLKGIPELAETMMVERDLSLLEYAGGKLHFNTISAGKSVDLIERAKKKGLKVSCDVAAYSLLLNDENLLDFDSRYKTMPPLRNNASIKELIKGITNGTIQSICSDHLPEDIESKKIELDHAAFGVINLQTAFSAANTALSENIELTTLIELFTKGPAEVLGINKENIQEGTKAEFTVFDPDEQYLFTKDKVKSKSKNSPFFNRELKGKVIGVINNGKAVLNDQ